MAAARWVLPVPYPPMRKSPFRSFCGGSTFPPLPLVGVIMPKASAYRLHVPKALRLASVISQRSKVRF